MKTISPAELKERLEREKLKILDVRTEEKFTKGHLQHHQAENINVFKEEIFQFADSPADKALDLPFTKDEEVIVTCTTGNSAGRCTEILQEKGYQVVLLEGGMTAWQQAKDE